MKRSPQCNRVETDDALAFCRGDGTALISDSGPVGAEAGTVKFGSAPVSSEIETSILPHTSTTPDINRVTGPTTVLPAHQIPGATQALSQPKRRKAIVAIAAVIARADCWHLPPLAAREGRADRINRGDAVRQRKRQC